MPAPARNAACVPHWRPIVTRILVVLFGLLMAGVVVLLGGYLLDDARPLLAPALARLSDPSVAADPSDQAVQVFTVRPGESAAQIGDELQKRNLIKSALAFRLVVDQEGLGGSIAAGDYELSRSMSTRDIAEKLGRGEVKRGLIVTIPEGWRAEQIADRLDSAGFTSRDEFLRAVGEPATVPSASQLAGAPPTLEGYLFPETYEVREKVPGTVAAEMMIKTFLKRGDAMIRSSTSLVSLSPRERLILASIVEREAKVAAERPVIASVYLNRLAEKMPLQADPTVQYALATRDGRAAASYGYWRGDLSPADLQLESPFNTYVRSGLPPAPICDPGEDSIRAVVQPAQTDYRYFVASGDGSHLFARTLDEHNANVARVGR